MANGNDIHRKPNSVLTAQNEKVLKEAKRWYRERIISPHKENAEKVLIEGELKVNDFTVSYLAKFLEGEVTVESVSRALIYPRVLGTSINTSFGQQIQTFITETLKDAYGSTAQGMDIVFTDQLDGRKIYCQIKLGTNTINKGDVDPIDKKYRDLINYSRTNNLKISHDDLMLGILMGSEHELNGHYKELRDAKRWRISVGLDFWHRLTGDPTMMHRLKQSFQEVVEEYEHDGYLDDLVMRLSKKRWIVQIVKDYKDAVE